MARPHKCRSINDATEATIGDAFESRGHNSVGLFVIAENLEPNNDSVTVVVDAGHDSDSDDQVEFAGPARQVGSGPGNTQQFGIDESDMSDPDGDETYSVFIYAHGMPLEFARARLSDYTDDSGSDLSVTAWLYFGNWNGPGREFREVV